MTSPWDGYTIPSPSTRIVKRAIDQFALWSDKLRGLGIAFDDGDAMPFWNLLSAIDVLTEEERVPLRAADASTFCGGSATTGKRKLAMLIRHGIVVTRKNPARRAETFVTVSPAAREAVIDTLDAWAHDYAADTAGYLRHRAGQATRGAA